MGLKSGDKARYYRERRKKNARRVRMRALRAALQNKAAQPSKAVAPKAAPATTGS